MTDTRREFNRLLGALIAAAKDYSWAGSEEFPDDARKSAERRILNTKKRLREISFGGRTLEDEKASQRP